MSATFSPCGTYRYDLQRVVDLNGSAGPGGRCTWIMLNPSTANATEDDPTIRRVTGFTRRWGLRAFSVGNLFAARCSNPDHLRTHFADPVGPENDWFLRELIQNSAFVVAAWGSHTHPRMQERVHAVLDLLKDHRLFCLGTTVNGSPRHPLYLPYKAPRVPFERKT